jgi:uncharacterized protein (DUF1501 family)
MTSRRSILGLGLRSLSTIGAASLLKNVALAGTNRATDQAVVFINLIGGNDSNNLIVPTSPAEYDAYSRGRRELAIPRSALLDIGSVRNTVTFGLHPSLVELRRLYDQGALAIVANVGRLVDPITKTGLLARQARIPSNLFQHTTSDQLRFVQPGFAVPAWTNALQSGSSGDKTAEVFGFSSGLSVVPAERTGIEGSALNNPTLLRAISGAPSLRTQFPATGLGLELQQAVRLLKVGPGLGLTRPVFSVSHAGFDTHQDQLNGQAVLFATLSQAMAAFHEATQEYGVASRVTTFTDTEFNRALRPNALRGTEHGWGGHQLVMGAAVRGGEVYGEFPSLELGGPNDAGTTGIWIPTTSRDHYHATMAGWLGIKPWDIERVMPGVRDFNQVNLGFLS